MYISLVMVVKNEELVLARALESFSGANRCWDELVITDTGSSDRTVEIARDFGARVVEKPWPNSFAEARNMAAAQASPQADLIFNPDADEVLGPGGDRLRSRLEECYAAGKRLFGLRYEFAHDEYGNPTLVFPRQDIYDPHLFKFVGRTHEGLSGPVRPDNTEYLEDITLYHRPKPNHGAVKVGRDLELLKLEVADNPKNSRTWYYLGREHIYARNWQEAIEALSHYLRLSQWTPERMAARIMIGDAHAALGHVQEATAFYTASIMEEPERREPYVALCKFFYGMQKWRQCVIWGEAALAIPDLPAKDSYQRPVATYTWYPHDLLSIAYYHLGEKAKGAQHLEIALSFRPQDERLLANRKWFA